MVLRSGIILPFQFGDNKKLLMIGTPQEERDLNLFDFINVVRAAFNIYSFIFRNKKIDFPIPEELLITYLEQCKDLTNFVIQIEQVFDRRRLQIHCWSCRCQSPYDQSKLDLDMTENSPNSNSAWKYRSNSTEGPLLILDSTARDLDFNNRGHKSLKRQKHNRSQRADANDEIEAARPKIRVATNLLEPYKPNTTVEDNTLSISNNMLPNESSEQREKINVAQSNNNPAPIEYFPQVQNVELPQQASLEQKVVHNYEEQQKLLENQQPMSQYPESNVPNQEIMNSRQRKERMSKRQKELYVEFIEQNPVVNKHRRNDPLLDIFWLRMANILNSCPNGAAKSVAEWKQAFDNWRYRVFLYARHNSQLSGEDAMNSKAFKPLTRTDKRAYNLWIRNPDTAPANNEKLPNDLIGSED